MTENGAAAKSLILSDLHLCTTKTPEDDYIEAWVRGQVERYRPSHLILNGDTFEISFSTAQRSTSSSPIELLHAILDAHKDLVSFLSVSASRLTFLVGEHDYFVAQPSLQAVLHDRLAHPATDIAEYVFDHASRTLVFHGHQMDYNVVHPKETTSLTDKLTEVFEEYVFQSAETRAAISEAVESQRFAYWYGAGSLPSYIEATGRLFGHDRRVYYDALAGLLRSEFLKTWIRSESSFANRSVARVARQIARLGPDVLRALSTAWWGLVESAVTRRSGRILHGKRIAHPDIPQDIFPVHHLVLGHGHKARAVRMRLNGNDRAMFMTTSPRWHVTGMWDGQLQLYRHSAVVVVDATDCVHYISEPEQHRASPEVPWRGGASMTSR